MLYNIMSKVKNKIQSMICILVFGKFVHLVKINLLILTCKNTFFGNHNM